MSKITQITSTEQFNTILADNQNVLVDFYADWCGPCKKFNPILETLAAKYNNCQFIKVNIDDNEELADQYSIKSVPTFLFFINGFLVSTTVGANEKVINTVLSAL
jgi:thioredoxin 1